RNTGNDQPMLAPSHRNSAPAANSMSAIAHASSCRRRPASQRSHVDMANATATSVAPAVTALCVTGRAYSCVLNLLTSPDTRWFYWLTLGWGVGIVAHALQVYGSFTIFGKDWEDRKIEQYMKRDHGS